ncbi:A/G-specific adenine glycosylase [Bacillaceae bacterium W0354]
MSQSTLLNIPVLLNIETFQDDLLSWYHHIKRDLPWRENQDPYRIWVSEIMLQQTQVDTVIPYFEQFMEQYPTVYHLAEADEQEVLKAWEGLGYYSRARNLHQAVKEVVTNYGGQVPRDKDKLKKLKGVGPYTLGAILSIAFDQPEPAVDGNVMRVLSRVLHIEEDIAKAKTRKLFEDAVRALISEEDPSSFNQGLMELGALICHPKKPKCYECPVREHCLAFEQGIQEELPVKTKAKKQKKLAYYGLILKNEADQFFIQKRPDEGLLAGLWEFPLVPQDEFSQADLMNLLYLDYGINANIVRQGDRVRHVFSHVIWEVDVVYCKVTHVDQLSKGKFVTLDEMNQYPMPNVQLKMKKLII